MNNWKDLTREEDFYALIEHSEQKPQIIFKDSTRCGISAYAKERLINGFGLIDGKADFHYLDLLRYRSISDLIARELKVTHQSPQIILIDNKQPVYISSHNAINASEIAKRLAHSL